MSPILGQGRNIRSDEWLAMTPARLSAAFTDYAKTNDILRAAPNGNLPVSGLCLCFAALARPMLWGYFLLGSAYGLSLSNTLFLVGTFLASFEMCLILTNRKRLYSLLGAWGAGIAMVFIALVDLVLMQKISVSEFAGHVREHVQEYRAAPRPERRARAADPPIMGSMYIEDVSGGRRNRRAREEGSILSPVSSHIPPFSEVAPETAPVRNRARAARETLVPSADGEQEIPRVQGASAPETPRAEKTESARERVSGAREEAPKAPTAPLPEGISLRTIAGLWPFRPAGAIGSRPAAGYPGRSAPIWRSATARCRWWSARAPASRAGPTGRTSPGRRTSGPGTPS